MGGVLKETVMFTKRRPVLVIVFVTVTLLAFSACAKDAAGVEEAGGKPAPVIVTFGTHHQSVHDPTWRDPLTGLPEMSPEDRRVGEKALQRVLEELNVRIKWVQYQGAVTEDLLRSVLAGDPLCDIAFLWGGSENVIIKQNVLQDLTPYAEIFDNDPEASWMLMPSVFGRRFLLGFQLNHINYWPLVFNVNYIERVDALRENGKTVYPTDLSKQGRWTWSVFEDYLSKIDAYYRNKPSPLRPEVPIKAYQTDYRFTALKLLHSAGQAVYGVNGMMADTPEAIRGIEFLDRIMTRGLVMSVRYDGSIVPGWTWNGNDFANGETVFTDIPFWMTKIAGSRLAGRGESQGIVPFPRPDFLAPDDPRYAQVNITRDNYGVLKGLSPERTRLTLEAFKLYYLTIHRERSGGERLGDYLSLTAEKTAVEEGFDIFHEKIGRDILNIFANYSPPAPNEMNGLVGIGIDDIVGNSIYGFDGSPKYAVNIAQKKHLLLEGLAETERIVASGRLSGGGTGDDAGAAAETPADYGSGGDTGGEEPPAAKTPKDAPYREKSYAAYLAKNAYAGRLASAVISLSLSGENETAGEDKPLSRSFVCREAGFYNILFEYMPVPGAGAAIEGSVFLDGEAPYKGLEQLIFNRLYDNSGGAESIPVKNGNEIRQRAFEVFEWNALYAGDSQKRSAEPYIVYLPPGEHRLTLEILRGDMLLRRVELRAAEPAGTAGAGTRKKYSGEALTFQAERTDGRTLAILKSARSIRNEADYSSVDTVPYHPYQTRLNVIGGSSWRAPGETITWEIDVPEDGLYGISFRAAQSLNRGVRSFRRLYINGVSPRAEALALGFGFSEGYRQYDLSAGGVYYRFRKGINRVTLENVVGPFAGPLSVVEESLAVLNALYLRTVQVTGLVPDRFIDYEITQKVSGFREILAEQSEILSGVVDTLVAITGEKNARTALVETMASHAARLSADPERVIPELAMFKGNISALGDWIISISEMPLYVDSFTLYAPDAGFSPGESSVFVKAWNGLVRFLATFFVDETKLGESETPRKALTVWVPTGREQAILIKNIVDDSFVPNYDIPVEMQLVPLEVVLPAALSGSGPDIVMDMPQANVLNFAVRNALCNFRDFPGCGETASLFYQSALDGAAFRGGLYGLPERQVFPMMYVRDDIFAALGLEPPKTWEEFYKVIAELNIYNYDVYVPVTGLSVFNSMVYQYGGNLYEGKGDDYGIASGLYSEAAMKAFTGFTSLYTAYKLPVQADFANRFRTGEMPLGIFDYVLYNTLEIFAPEIRGLWSFHPLPGVPDKEGGIKNDTVATMTYTVILNSCEDKEAAWDFTQWWLSTEIQTEYSLQLEAALGAAGRHSTANPEAFADIPWSRDAAEALLAQFEHTVGVPEIPGGYMTARMVDYAFRSVVTGSGAMQPRQALYMNLLAIDKELTKKRTEFHLSVPEETAR
jgi:ABC-type glycerol-3-phosphate transport system substrate-binding protein